MSKEIRKYTDIDVLTAAKERIRNLINLFDTLIICFSGGKDSLVVLNLVQEVYDELGIKQKLKVIFRDEEVIPDDVIDFVQDIYKSGKYDFTYYCIPLKSEKFILGNKEQYIQWDKNREHIRKVPDYAVTDWDNVYDQYSADEFITRQYKGKKVLITGIRADESLIRLRSIVNKKNDSYYAATDTKGVMIGKPIYDWSEKDIFKYMLDKEIKYAKIYDAQLFNGESLRVSTPLHAESSKRIFKIKTRYPIFWNQLVALFPDIELQARYYGELSKDNVFRLYPLGVEGIRKYIDDNIDDDFKPAAIDKLRQAISMRNNNMAKGATNYGGYPLLYIFKQFINGNYKRVIQPKKHPTKDDLAYEQEVAAHKEGQYKRD